VERVLQIATQPYSGVGLVLVAVVVDSSGSSARSVSTRPEPGLRPTIRLVRPVLHGLHSRLRTPSLSRPRFCRPTAPAKLPASTDRAIGSWTTPYLADAIAALRVEREDARTIWRLISHPSAGSQ